MPRHRSSISRDDALRLSAMAREIQPHGDATSFRLSAIQARAARAALGRSVDCIAALAGVSTQTVENIEAGINAARDDTSKIGFVLESLGATFVRKGDLQGVVFRR